MGYINDDMMVLLRLCSFFFSEKNACIHLLSHFSSFLKVSTVCFEVSNFKNFVICDNLLELLMTNCK